MKDFNTFSRTLQEQKNQVKLLRQKLLDDIKNKVPLAIDTPCCYAGYFIDSQLLIFDDKLWGFAPYSEDSSTMLSLKVFNDLKIGMINHHQRIIMRLHKWEITKYLYQQAIMNLGKLQKRLNILTEQN